MSKVVDFHVDGWDYIWVSSENYQVAFCLQESNYRTHMLPMEDSIYFYRDTARPALTPTSEPR